MIQLTKINGHQIVLNSDLIQYMEETPDTVVTMTTGEKVIVSDRMVEIIDKVVRYRRTLAGLVEVEYKRRFRDA